MMDVLYQLIEQCLPYSWTQYTFMKNAFIAIILITPIFGILSTMVVNNKMAFFSDSIGHSALTGVGLGVLLGLNSPVWSMILFSVIFSVFIVIVKNTNTISTDTIISVFSSTTMAVGLVIITKAGFNKYSTYLIGDLLSITPAEIGILAILLVVIILIWFLMFNKLLVVSVNPSLASSRGMNVFMIEMIFTIVIAVVVTVSIRWIGLLIINSLLILPAAAARNISRDIRQYHVFSLLISFVSGVGGLILSYYWGSTTGATITLLCAVFYFITFAMHNRFA